jgi:hypothetical protein
MHYPLNKNNARLRKKYSDCSYVVVCGSTVRQLTQREIGEFRERVEQVIGGKLPKRKPGL